MSIGTVAKIIQNVHEISKYYIYYPKIAALITSHWKDCDNIMPSSWTSPISSVPPLYGIALSPKRCTYDFIIKSKEFGVNFIPFKMGEMAASSGGSSGRYINKFTKFKIAAGKPVKTSIPILTDAYATFECELVDSKKYGDHYWLVGKIVVVHLTEGILHQNNLLNVSKVSPLLYIGRDTYLTTASETEIVLDREIYKSVSQNNTTIH